VRVSPNKPGVTLCSRIASRYTVAMAGFACAVVTLVCASAAAAALQPLGLSVDDGEESWHAEQSFALRWSNPPEPVAAVHYRLLDPWGGIARAEMTLGWAATAIQSLPVLSTPGAYTAEIWLEDDHGAEGAPVSAKLRFDDSRPAQVEPLPADGWIGRAAFPYSLQITHPPGPMPLSGIRGYAFSIGATGNAAPCAGQYVCSEAETDLRGGVAGDTLSIADLPEGLSYVHALAVSGSGMRSALAGSTTLRVDKADPATALSGLIEGWSSQPLRLTAKATDAASGMAAAGASGPFTAIRIDDGAPIIAGGSSVSASLIDSGRHLVEYYSRDAAGNVADGGSTNGHRNHAPASAVVRIDRDAPRIAFAGAQDPRDPERIEARAVDSLSGLDPSRGSISVRRVGSGERFATLPTELSGELLRARWDSDSYPAGEYEFRAVVYDEAGNSASTGSRGSGSAMRLRSPLKVATKLFADSGQRTVPYGRRASFGGRLVAGRRAPLAGVPVRVIERFDAGATPRERVSMVRTTASGAFGIRLEPGPSRQVLAVVTPTAALRGASSQPLRLAVRGGVHLRASAAVAEVGGRPVVFSGRVETSGGMIPPEGKAVQLQFRLPGLPWAEFRTVKANSRGRFRYAYRFADDDSRGARFQFRAFTPAQAGWPFEPAGSPTVVVRGR
jgi:hypothetical protein